MRPCRALTLPLGLFGLLCFSTVGLAQSSAELASSRYSVDGMHSTVGFATTLLRAVKVRGRFDDYDATIIYDEKHPERSSVSAIIQAKSINTNMGFRDDHLRSPDFFDVKTYPTIEFVSDRVVPHQGGATVSGMLTMHGVTRRITFPVQLALAPYLIGSTRGVAFTANLRLSRKDFGIAGTNKFNPDYNPLTNMLSDNVDIVLELDAIRDGFATRRLGDGTPPSVSDTINKTLQAHGIDAAIRTYHSLRATEPASFNFGAYELDLLGRKLSECGDLPDAVEILKTNASQFADSAGVLESLAETQSLSNDRSGATETYRRVLAKFPSNVNAREMLRHLERLSPDPGMAATSAHPRRRLTAPGCS
jgi:polyisoprenoid-binding protein YceI